MTIDVLSKTAACAQLAGDEQLSGEFVKRALRSLPAADDPPQRTVLRVLLTLNMVQLDRGESSQLSARRARTAALAKALNVAPAAAEAYWIVAIEACIAAQSGDIQSALRQLETLSSVQGKTTAFSAQLMNAYLLAVDGQSSRAQAALVEVRKRASPRYPDTHPVHRTMEYVDAVINAPDTAEREQRMAKALTALEASTGRKARLPLAPHWFAF